MREEAATPTPSSPTPSPSATTDETNTGMNVRDRDGSLPTPVDQSNSEGDLQITARIRQAILDDQALSVTAENIKIITVNGKVTLRGPVKDAAEKSAIVAKAQQVAGTTQVDDQLEIANSGTGTNTGG
jgi:osmotically-inducible protein OsmY